MEGCEDGMGLFRLGALSAGGGGSKEAAAAAIDQNTTHARTAMYLAMPFPLSARLQLRREGRACFSRYSHISACVVVCQQLSSGGGRGEWGGMDGVDGMRIGI